MKLTAYTLIGLMSATAAYAQDTSSFRSSNGTTCSNTVELANVETSVSTGRTIEGNVASVGVTYSRPIRNDDDIDVQLDCSYILGLEARKQELELQQLEIQLELTRQQLQAAKDQLQATTATPGAAPAPVNPTQLFN